MRCHLLRAPRPFRPCLLEVISRLTGRSRLPSDQKFACELVQRPWWAAKDCFQVASDLEFTAAFDRGVKLEHRFDHPRWQSKAQHGLARGRHGDVNVANVTPRCRRDRRCDMTAGTTFGVYALSPLTMAFARLAPLVHLELTLTDRVVDIVDEGFDIAIRTGTLPSSTLRARRLSDYTMLVAAAPDYLARRGTPRTSAQLARHDVLGFLGGSSPQWRFSSRKRSGNARVAIKPIFHSNSGAALR